MDQRQHERFDIAEEKGEASLILNGLVGFAGKAAYNSAKHGLIGLTKVAALEGAEYNIMNN